MNYHPDVATEEVVGDTVVADVVLVAMARVAVDAAQIGPVLTVV